MRDIAKRLAAEGYSVLVPNPFYRVAKAPVIVKDKKTGLPLIECKQAAAPPDEITPERVADLLLAQEAGWHHAAGR